MSKSTETRSAPTFVGLVERVSGAEVSVAIDDLVPASLMMLNGAYYRVGQVGSFYRIVLGYISVFGICVEMAAAGEAAETESDFTRRSMRLALFGEDLGDGFRRGISQYPTVGVDVHVLEQEHLNSIYAPESNDNRIVLGHLSGAELIASVALDKLVSRHSAIVGSTGSGKSNLVALILNRLLAGPYTSARVIVLDMHGEYRTGLGDGTSVFSAVPGGGTAAEPLVIPFWALSAEALLAITLGDLQPSVNTAVRDLVTSMRIASLPNLNPRPDASFITADSPIPFSIKKLWYDLYDFEVQTFTASNAQSEQNVEPREDDGDPLALKPPRYPAADPYNRAPYYNQRRRQIIGRLDAMRARLVDPTYAFLFAPGKLEPDLDGRIERDLDDLLSSWIGKSRVTIFDLSGINEQVADVVATCILRMVFEALKWSEGLAISGTAEPLLVVVEEAHRFLREDSEASTGELIATVAREGRKQGIGLMLVSQRPSEIAATALSQCGTILALRTTNAKDRAAVASILPDDLGGMVSILPSLRTGELVAVGDAVSLPTRMQIDEVVHQGGRDARLPDGWTTERPPTDAYQTAVMRWRQQRR